MDCEDLPLEKPYVNGFATSSSSKSSTADDPVKLEQPKTEILNDDVLQSDILNLRLLFKQVYQKRLSAIENCDHLDVNKKNEEKLAILEACLQQLEEQNDVLVSNLIELENEAHQRVKQMERRLKTSAKSTMEAVVNLHDCEQEMRRLVNEKLHIESIFNNMQAYLTTLKVENSFLRDQNFNLNHDVQALLHVIHHARSTGHWEMDCVTFCEVTPEQVFGPVQSISQMYSSESPHSYSQLTERERKVFANSDPSSQEISHSSMSSPSISHPLDMAQVEELNMQFVHHDESNEVKDKTIAVLETRLAEAKHHLKMKEAECECHVWKIEELMAQKQNRTFMVSGTQRSCDISLPKCISLPDIGNIYTYTNIMRKTHSCEKVLGNFSKSNIRHIGITHDDQSKQDVESQECRPACRTDCGYSIHRSHTEPHLVISGDIIYVYRPCESVKLESDIALHENQQLSLKPCQSIELKFPTEDSNKKHHGWDFIYSPDPYSVPTSSTPLLFQKVGEPDSSCGSTDSEDVEESRNSNLICNIDNTQNISQNSYISSMSGTRANCRLAKVQLYPVIHPSDKCRSLLERPGDVVSSYVQTEETHISTYSIGLQADGFIKDVNSLNENDIVGMDAYELNQCAQKWKDSLIKAEDKATAKAILIEQLQGHLSSSVKEVEMRDKALSNLEKKLNNSRLECTSLMQHIASLDEEIQHLLQDLEDARMLNDNLSLNVEARKDQIEEIRDQHKTLQNEKRSLMIQLDAQGDELVDSKKELEIMKLTAQKSALQIEQQNQIIKTLQEAIVQSKRAFDAVHSNKPLLPLNASLNLQTKVRQTSKSSIVDI